MPLSKGEDRLPLRCRAWGHDVNREALHYYGVTHCEWCGLEGDNIDVGPRERLKVRWWRITEWCRDTVGMFRRWLRCSDCGHWMGRHDENIDHLPF